MHILKSAGLWILALALLAVGEVLTLCQGRRGKEGRLWTGASTTPGPSGSN